MSASPFVVHYVSLGDDLTACGEAASGKGGVLLRSEMPGDITCKACRSRAKLQGRPTKRTQRTAEAGRILERAVAKYGSIGQHQKRRR